MERPLWKPFSAQIAGALMVRFCTLFRNNTRLRWLSIPFSTPDRSRSPWSFGVSANKGFPILGKRVGKQRPDAGGTLVYGRMVELCREFVGRRDRNYVLLKFAAKSCLAISDSRARPFAAGRQLG